MYDPNPKIQRKVPETCLREGESERTHHSFATGNKSPKTSSAVVHHLNNIPHNIFIDAMHGYGMVWRKTEHVQKEILNDISSKRLNCSKAIACSTQDNTNCERFKDTKTGSQDYRPVVRRNDKECAPLHQALISRFDTSAYVS